MPYVTTLEWLKPRFKFRLIWLQRPLSSYNTLMLKPWIPLRERKTKSERERQIDINRDRQEIVLSDNSITYKKK